MYILCGPGFNYTKDESQQMNKYISHISMNQRIAGIVALLLNTID